MFVTKLELVSGKGKVKAPHSEVGIVTYILASLIPRPSQCASFFITCSIQKQREEVWSKLPVRHWLACRWIPFQVSLLTVIIVLACGS